MDKKSTKIHSKSQKNSSELAANPQKKSKILIYACNWIDYNPKSSKNNAISEITGFNIIRVMCAARVNRQLLLEAIQQGYEGILILSCNPEECQHKGGDQLARARVNATALLLENLGINQQRIKFHSIKRGDLSELSNSINEFEKMIADLN